VQIRSTQPFLDASAGSGIAEAFKHMTEEMLKEIATRVCGLVFLSEGIAYFRNGLTAHPVAKYGGVLRSVRLQCEMGRQGQHEGSSSTAVSQRDCGVSKKCKCSAGFTLHPTGFILWSDKLHKHESYLTDNMLMKQIVPANVEMQLTSPCRLLRAMHTTSAHFERNNGNSKEAVRRQLQGTLGQVLPDSATGEAQPFGATLIPTVLAGAKKMAQGCFGEDGSGEGKSTAWDRYMTEIHARPPEDFKFKLLPSQHNPDVITAVHTWDKQTAPTTSPDVILSDATHGVLGEHFAKQSTWTSVSPSRKLTMILQSSLQHEDIPTFRSEADMILEIYPELAIKEVVFFVDGDPAKLSVVKTCFRGALIALDIHHLSQNFRQKVGNVVGGVRAAKSKKHLS
jgi:hypothetical protein